MSSLLPVPDGAIAAIVTYLEMFGRPESLPPKPQASLSLEQRRKPDLDWYRNLYRQIGEEWLWFSRLLMNDQQLVSVIHHPNVSVYALSDGERDIGLLELDWRQAPDCEIVFFGLVPQAISQGAGAWMMGETQRIAFDVEGATRLWLHTCTLDHPQALPFYLRQGFRAFRREIEIAPDPRLTGDMRADAAAFHPIIGSPAESGGAA